MVAPAIALAAAAGEAAGWAAGAAVLGAMAGELLDKLFNDNPEAPREDEPKQCPPYDGPPITTPDGTQIYPPPDPTAGTSEGTGDASEEMKRAKGMRDSDRSRENRPLTADQGRSNHGNYPSDWGIVRVITR